MSDFGIQSFSFYVRRECMKSSYELKIYKQKTKIEIKSVHIKGRKLVDSIFSVSSEVLNYL